MDSAVKNKKKKKGVIMVSSVRLVDLSKNESSLKIAGKEKTDKSPVPLKQLDCDYKKSLFCDSL